MNEILITLDTVVKKHIPLEDIKKNLAKKFDFYSENYLYYVAKGLLKKVEEQAKEIEVLKAAKNKPL